MKFLEGKWERKVFFFLLEKYKKKAFGSTRMETLGFKAGFLPPMQLVFFFP